MKPDSLFYPYSLDTLGDHIRSRRLDPGLRQKGIARKIGVDKMSDRNWESNRTQPRLNLISRIIDFLDYIPRLEPGEKDEAFVENVLRMRCALFIRQDDLARQICVDPTTLAR